MNSITNSFKFVKFPPSQFWTWLMIIATASMTFAFVVEMINIIFYDPYEDEDFLFRTVRTTGRHAHQ